MTVQTKAYLASWGILIVTCWAACSGSQPQVTISDPKTLCANALVMTQEVRTQASKLGIEPAELAQQVCSTAILGAKLAEANIKSLGIAGAANSPADIQTAGMGSIPRNGQ